MYTVEYEPAAEKQLAKLPKDVARGAIPGRIRGN
jgi:mRNA-degrading endonuclease RelE of RelBE toxin-antitoxin system